MNPLEWSGPDFLKLYAPLVLLSLVGAWLVRYMLRAPGGLPLSHELQRLDPYQTALLVGRGAALNAAMASLFRAQVLHFGTTGPLVMAPHPAGAHPLECSLRDTVAQGAKTRKALLKGSESELEQVEDTLIQRGLLVERERMKKLRALTLLPLGGVMVLGLAKLWVGLQRGRPVDFLVVLIIFGSVLGMSLWKTERFRRSKRGDAALKWLRERHEALPESVGPSHTVESLSPGQLILAVGLFGTAALASPQYKDLQGYLDRSGGAGGDGGGGDGDGGGGGCGGCGGD
jgi:uncharacterized protein (TIGR04222 family)